MIKVRQMLSTASTSPTTLDVARQVIHHEGVGALYKGLPAALLRAVISGGGRLTGYNQLKAVAIQYGVLHEERPR